VLFYEVYGEVYIFLYAVEEIVQHEIQLLWVLVSALLRKLIGHIFIL